MATFNAWLCVPRPESGRTPGTPSASRCGSRGPRMRAPACNESGPDAMPARPADLLRGSCSRGSSLVQGGRVGRTTSVDTGGRSVFLAGLALRVARTQTYELARRRRGCSVPRRRAWLAHHGRFRWSFLSTTSGHQFFRRRTTTVRPASLWSSAERRMGPRRGGVRLGRVACTTLWLGPAGRNLRLSTPSDSCFNSTSAVR